MLNKFKLSTKLVGAFIILALVGGLLVGITSIVNIQNINNLGEKVYNENLVPLSPLYRAGTEFLKIRIELRDMALSKAADKSQYITKMNDSNSNVTNDLVAYGKNISSVEESQNLKSLMDTIDKYNALRNKIIDMLMSNQLDGALVIMDSDGTAVSKEIDLYISKAFEINVTQAKERNASNSTAENNALILMGLIVLLSVGLSTLFGVFLSRSISKPLLMGVQNLSESAQQVAAASQQLATSSQSLAESNSEQASSIQETSSTLEESSSMIQQNSENTKQALQLSAQTKASSDKGNSEMKEMMLSMNEIKKSSDQIAKIIKVIDDIAFQTNILALNAAVEAARAGDAGMGFAVVAEEVRNLAQRSAQAAKDTASMIETNIQLSVKGVNVSKKVADVLEEIALQAKKVNELMDEITAASQEQTQGIGQINKAMSQMEQVTQQNAATAEESAAASQQLSSQAQTVEDIVQELSALIQGNSYKMNTNMRNAGSISHKQSQKHMYSAISSVRGPLIMQQGIPGNSRRKTQIMNPNDVIPFNADNEDF